MNRSLREISKQALTLPLESREALARVLWESVERDQDAVDAAWLKEVLKREQAVLNGKAELLDGDEVMQGLRKRLGK